MKPRGSADLRARDSQQFHLGVVVLGAGASTRMGRPKMLLPWGGSTIVGHAINIWRKLGAAQIAVVHAERDVPMITELKRLQLPASGRIANPAPAQGMFSSVLCAAQWPRWEIGLTHWLVSLGDQPHLRMSTLHRLVEFATKHGHEICQPAFENRPRHPVIFPRRFWSELATTVAPATITLRDFLAERSAAVLWMPSDDPGLAFDIDTQDDYERALISASE